MATSYTGVRVVETTPDRINELYKNKKIGIKKDYPNTFLVFKSENQSALARVDIAGLTAHSISDKLAVGKIKPKNKEQFFALSTLLDPEIKVCTLTGTAGAGKSLLSIAAGMQGHEEGLYTQIILTRPMDPMGQMKELGAMPGNIDDKFGIYLHNFTDNIDVLITSANKKSKETFLPITEQYNMQFIPMQVMRGASFSNAFIIADEIQTLTRKQLLGLGTRVGYNSKLVLLGDMSQRDSNIKKIETGLYQFINSEVVKDCKFTSHIDLIKCERSDVSSLFANVLGED